MNGTLRSLLGVLALGLVTSGAALAQDHSGHGTPVFEAGDLTFGIVICRDSTYAEPARAMAAAGATVLFVPTNNGLPPTSGGADIVEQSRTTDIARAKDNGVSVIRADVAGHADGLVSHGSSGIVNLDGAVLRTAKQLQCDLIVADIQTTPNLSGR